MTPAGKRWLGVTFWSVSLAGASVWMLSGTATDATTPGGERRATPPASLISESMWLSLSRFEIIDPTGVVRVGDVAFAPVAKTDPSESSETLPWEEVGYVTAVRRQQGMENLVTLAMFHPEVCTPDAAYTVHRNSGRLGDVLATLIPERKREALQGKLAAVMEAHADAVAREMMPLIMKSIQVSVPLVEHAIGEAITRHEAEVNALVSRYRKEIVRDRILPLVREEVLPIVRKHGREPAESIGREVWHRASLFRFGWRAIYDKSPLPERELVVEEWRRFVDQEVTPIVEAHLDEIASAVENTLKDLAANKRLREEFSEVGWEIAYDPEARDLFRTILREAIVENVALHQAWQDVWTSSEAQQRLRRAGKRMEPVLRQLGDELMGTREQGIEPGFARVLRNQVLAKDRTWITITPNQTVSKQPVRLKPAKRFMPYPVVRLAISD